MKRLTAYVSGEVQKVGYRARVIDTARAFGLKGMVENLPDGRVKIIADGDDKRIEWFEDAIDVKNTLIHVTSIEKQYSEPGDEFDAFGKFVIKDETGDRLDIAAVHLKDLIVAINNMNNNLGGKMDVMIKGQESLNEKMDKSLAKQDQMLSKQDDLLVEVKDMNRSLNGKIDRTVGKSDVMEMKADISDVKAALRAKGII